MESSVTAVLDVVAGRAPWLGGVPPERLAALLDRHALGGLALSAERRRSDAGRGVLPREVTELLLPSYHRTALHTTLLLESAGRALGVLADAGVPALLFKGAALVAQGVYAEPAERPLEDVDLLVRPEHAPAAVAALTAHGFAPWSPWSRSRMGWMSSLTLTDGSAPAGTSATLDLHWATPYRRLRQSGPWKEDSLWEGAVGTLPAVEPHFVVIAEHLLKHLRVAPHLRGAADLARLAPRLADRELLLSQCRARGSLGEVRMLLAFLRDVIGVPVAPAILRHVAVPAELGGHARARLDPVRLVTGASDPSSGLAGIVEDWLLIGSPLHGALELLRVAVPPGRWLRDRYPSEGPRLRRARYLREIVRWMRGSGPSPLSPNQEW